MIVKTFNKPCEIEIFTNAPENAILKAFDKSKPNTVYYKRFIDDNIKNYIIKLPISPEILTIKLVDCKNCIIINYKVNSLKKRELKLNSETIKFIEFAKHFVTKAGYIDVGLYKDKNNLFVIDYMYRLKNRGVEVATPARIGVTNNVIQISKKQFKNMSIPDRFLILMHEYSHNYINKNPDNEREADKWAEIIYFSLGFPIFNGVDILYRILGNSKLSENRLKQVYDYANFYGEKATTFTSSII